MKSSITLNVHGITSFADADKLNALAGEAAVHLRSLRDGTGRGNDFLGWLNLPETARLSTGKIMACANRLRSQAPVTVVIGIGGSYLGAKALIDALSDPFAHPGHRIIFAGHTLSEDYHAALLRHLDGIDYNIVVISKSGTTTEPAIAFRILRNHLSARTGKENVSRYIVAVTDAHRGALHNLAVTEGYETFVIPDDVGGRYSVLTPVGLLPLALAGYDIDEFIRGMQTMAALTRDNDDPSNIALVYAAARNILYGSGYLTEILVSYEPTLAAVAEWWKQLFGESEGKENRGIFPASVSFTTDLHSMGQYIQEGERHFLETVISVTASGSEMRIPVSPDDSDGVGFIAGRKMTEVNERASAATRLAHISGGVPNIVITVPCINEFYLGQLLYFFEISCAVSGYILGVNPFNQPGVESYKKNMFALLGKPGYEKEKERLEKELKVKS
ncbi:MAG TPA: glucose-6-phosphate isomerase [Bacteroidales bacterium]|nr:glucose-6-phosphate isomerase [Bacteroidales bacterium]